ncbi:phospholipid/cholesterol/gamma-HCH transport system substrate-binding protein [Mycobacterium sp. MAA66]|uniref:MCE family protein n=1 Tax=Mycobacterium sp. MAA66 TaxID=3156297 RepID=UPI0035179FAE
MNKKLKIAVITMVVGIALATAGFAFVPAEGEQALTVTAQFEDAVGLYTGNAVSVLGMRVGEVVSIVAKGSYVDVTLKIDAGTNIPADVQAVTVNTSLLTDRHVELTPVYQGGPKLKNGDLVSLARTRTPVEIGRTLASLDRLSHTLSGDGKGNGPFAEFIAIGDQVTSQSGPNLKATLDKLSQALRLSDDHGEHTAADIQSIVKNLNELTQAATNNDTAIRDFGSDLHQVSDILADEQLGSGTTGKDANHVLAVATDLLERNRDKLKGVVKDSQGLTTTLVDNQRGLAETFDLLPLLADNTYNAVDTNAGALRATALFDKTFLDSGVTKELCNLTNKKQLGCATGTSQDYSPDFGLSQMLDLMGVNKP